MQQRAGSAKRETGDNMKLMLKIIAGLAALAAGTAFGLSRAKKKRNNTKTEAE